LLRRGCARNSPPLFRRIDDKTDAVVLYAETTLTVQPNGKIKRLYRAVVRILRPDGEARAPYANISTRRAALPICMPVHSRLR